MADADNLKFFSYFVLNVVIIVASYIFMIFESKNKVKYEVNQLHLKYSRELEALRLENEISIRQEVDWKKDS
jgi:hypothetical protein